MAPPGESLGCVMDGDDELVVGEEVLGSLVDEDSQEQAAAGGGVPEVGIGTAEDDSQQGRPASTVEIEQCPCVMVAAQDFVRVGASPCVAEPSADVLQRRTRG